MAEISVGFKDISLSFTPNPITNDLLVIRNEDAVKKSVTNLVRTNIGERFFNSLIGSRVNDSVFELANREIEISLSGEIKTLLRNFETRIRVRDVSVEVLEDEYQLNIKVVYDIVGFPIAQQNLEFILQPTRV